MTEEFGFYQAFGKRCAVHADEWSVAARRIVVNRLGNQLLAGSRFTPQNHCRVTVSDSANRLEHIRHLLAAANDLRERVTRFDFSSESSILSLDPLPLKGAIDDDAQLPQIDRLSEVIVSTLLDGTKRCLCLVVSGHHDDHGLWTGTPDLTNVFQTVSKQM